MRVAPWMLVGILLIPLAGCTSATERPSTPEAPAAPNPPRPPPRAPAAPSGETPGPSFDERFLFFPTKYPEGNWQPAGLSFEDAWFRAADGTRLHGWYCPCPGARAVLLYAHGNAGNLALYGALMRYFQKELRLTSLVFDYRGYGRSDGVPTVAGILQDARAARGFLARRAGVEEREVVLMGRSLGGAVAVMLAGNGARGLIVESTFSSLRDVAAKRDWRLAWLVPPGKLDSVAQISKYKGPLLQSHGTADDTIPEALGMKLFAAANEPKQFVSIPRTDHNDPQSAEYYRLLDGFIAKLPGG